VSERILAAYSPGELRTALVRGETLLDYALHHPADPDGVGDLHLARVQAVLPALGGAFLELGGSGGAQSGFLPENEVARPLAEGDVLGVRITRSAQGGKGPRLSALLDERESRIIADAAGRRGLASRGPDPLDVLARAHPGLPILCDDPALAARLHGEFASRVRLVSTAFDEAVEEQVAGLASPRVELPGGLSASITPTPALVAIDLDTGPASDSRLAKQAAQFAANRTALPALLHQLRLRDLSGAILIDPAGLAQRKRPQLRPVIETALAADPGRPRLVGFTGLGLIEIVRPRIRTPLHERLARPHAAAAAALRAARAAMLPPGSARVTVCGGSAVIAALEADEAARADFARLSPAGLVPVLRLDAALQTLAWRIEHG